MPKSQAFLEKGIDVIDVSTFMSQVVGRPAGPGIQGIEPPSKLAL